MGQYLIRHDYLSGPQWTKWSVEEPPEDALEIESAQGWRSRNVGMAEKDYKGYASLEAAEADADAYITSQRNAFADEYGLEQEQTEMGTASETSSSMTSFVDGDIDYSYGYSWDQTSVTFYDVFAPGAPEWETPIGMMRIASQTYWVKRATFFSPWSDWMTDEEKPAASDNMEIEEATVYRYRTR